MKYFLSSKAAKIFFKLCHPILETLFITILLLLTLIHHGPIFTSDTTEYARQANLLIQHSFNYHKYLNSISPKGDVVWPLYTGFVTVVAATKILFGSHWALMLALINITLIAISIYFLLRLIKSLYGPKMTLFATLLIILCVNSMTFPTKVLSDSSYQALTFFTFLSFFSCTQKTPCKLLWIIFAITLTIIDFFYRPTGFPILASGAFLIFLFFFDISTDSKRACASKKLTLLVSSSLILLIVLAATIIQNPTPWIRFLHINYKPLVHFVYWIRNRHFMLGTTINNRHSLRVAGTPSIFFFTKLALIKFAYFFSPILPGYSKIHILINLMFFLPAYCLSLIGTIKLFDKEQPSIAEFYLTWLAIIFLLSFALFHAFTEIDYDLRYRLPIIFPIIILACIGLKHSNNFIFKIKSNMKKCRLSKKTAFKN